MKQQQTFRGFMFIILMLILLMLALRFPYARQAQTVTAQEFEQILGSGNVAEAVISPNPQTPSGYVTVTLANGQTVRQNVSDVKDAEQLLKDNSIDYSMEDVPQENTLLTVVMPFMLSIVVVVVIVTMMNRGAAGGGSNARMMNFGRSRAKLSRDSKVNFTNVAGLEEEKEELEEVVDFLKNPQKYTSVGARIPKGMLLVGPPGTGFDLRGEAFDLSPLEKVTGRLEQSAKIMEQANEGTEAVRQLLQAVKEQTAIQKQLPAPDILQKATNRVTELEHLIGKYQEKLDSLSEDKTMIIRERVEWEQKYYERDKQNYALLETLKKQGELLEKAKTELRHCKGFFSSANEDVLKELGIS